ncbi:sensor histidine kinase [Nonomuraea fuscirosea]|uniref:sensor histidine kinase n=1 Tax=Nonomuraea fuscirosea TaxID=1291556 RepID=UPI003F4D2973
MTPLRAWSRSPMLQDAAPAAVLLAICVLVNAPNAIVGNTAGTPVAAGQDGQLALWWAATALAAGGVVLRRRWPLPMLVVCVLSAGVHVAQAAPLMIIDLSVLVLLYTVASRYAWVISLAALTCLLLVAAGWSLYGPLPGPSEVLSMGPGLGTPSGPKEVMRVHRQASADAWSGLSVLGSALVASWAIGSGARSRRAYLDELHAHARDLERERDQQAALAVAAERARISRELHDVVAHGLSLMVIQAQGGAAALDNTPADTRTALETIVTTGRNSLADMRHVLAAVGEVDDAWHPQPGLAHLPALLTQVNRAGTPVRLRVEGSPVTLPATMDLSAYRIVQEALTNTMKHAGTGAAASVVLTYHHAEIGIEISDNGRARTGDAGAGNTGAGNGLRGMRERVKLLGGTFTAGPKPRGGFTVRASLPILGHAT